MGMTANASRRGGSTRRWRRTRQLVFQRDGHQCALCGGYGNDIDHLRPVSAGGTDALYNLRVLCRKCNLDRRPTRHRHYPNREQTVHEGAISIE